MYVAEVVAEQYLGLVGVQIQSGSITLFRNTPSEYNLVHFSYASDSIEVMEASGRDLFEISLVLRRLLPLLNDRNLIEHWLQNKLIEALVDEPVRLW